MTQANFVFHGLFPDVRQSGKTHKEIAKVLFDIDFNGQFYSHLIADIEYLDASHELEVRCQLPIQCEQFAHAAVNYYQFALGPQKNTISHSGPKGPSILTHNVIRAEWGIALEASALT